MEINECLVVANVSCRSRTYLLREAGTLVWERSQYEAAEKIQTHYEIRTFMTPMNRRPWKSSHNYRHMIKLWYSQNQKDYFSNVGMDLTLHWQAWSILQRPGQEPVNSRIQECLGGLCFLKLTFTWQAQHAAVLLHLPCWSKPEQLQHTSWSSAHSQGWSTAPWIPAQQASAPCILKSVSMMIIR